MKIGYIYPQWYHAQRTLIEMLSRIAPSQKKELTEVVCGFFHNYMFELGVDVRTDAALMERANIDVASMNQHKAVTMIADEIIKNNLFVRQTTQISPYHWNDRFTVLIFGGDGSNGPGSREKTEREHNGQK